MSQAIIKKLSRRRAYPVNVDGEKLTVRALLISEHREAMEFSEDDLSLSIAIGFGLLGDDGKPLFPRTPGEAIKDFGERVQAELDKAEVPTDTRAQLAKVIIKLSAGPTDEQIKALEKN